jgi:hypothetical protein
MTTSGHALQSNLILDIYLSAAERNMADAENFIRSQVNEYEKHSVSTDMVFSSPFTVLLTHI